jgi:hypothetical protein
MFFANLMLERYVVKQHEALKAETRHDCSWIKSPLQATDLASRLFGSVVFLKILYVVQQDSKMHVSNSKNLGFGRRPQANTYSYYKPSKSPTPIFGRCFFPFDFVLLKACFK